jgi:ribosome biogenesis GTPase
VLTGTVLRGQGGVYEVETADGVVEAGLRGKLKRDERSGDKVVVGDRVDMEPEKSGEGTVWAIQRVHERTSVLARRAPGKAPRPKLIAANLDQVLIVFAAANPMPHLRMLDRFLVIAEDAGIPPVIVVNKTDVSGEGEARRTFAPYVAAGYTVIFSAAKRGVGVDPVLNAIQPGLGLRVAEISEALNKGRHTTVTAQLIPLECGGYVADTPGLRELGLWEVDRDNLQFYFPEFESVRYDCRYSGCTHVHEPGCAIRAAVDAGRVDPGRYESYRRMMTGEDDDFAPSSRW